MDEMPVLLDAPSGVNHFSTRLPIVPTPAVKTNKQWTFGLIVGSSQQHWLQGLIRTRQILNLFPLLRPSLSLCILQLFGKA